MADPLEVIEKHLAVRDQILRDDLARVDEKLIRMLDLDSEMVQNVAVLAEQGKTNTNLNRILVIGILVLAGAEKAITYLG